MDLSLNGCVAVVTGASRGIGLAVTRTLLTEGARVVAVSRRSSPDLDALAGGSLIHVRQDVLDPDTPALTLNRAVQEYGGLDILVNAAGGAPEGVELPRTSFLDAADSDWEAVFRFNLFSVVRFVREAVPLMRIRGGGSIVNVSSANARNPSQLNVDYGAAKAGLSNLSKALSSEFAPEGIRVNTVSPGPVRTWWWTAPGGVADILADRMDIDRDEVLETVAPASMQLSTGRMIEPQEVADQIVLLASPRSGSTTGTEVFVDGGMMKGL